MKISRIAALMFLAAAAPVLAQVRIGTLAHEALPSMVRLPTGEGSELTLQVCATCQVLRLRATSATTYFVGDQQVTLAEFTKYIDTHPDAPMVISQLPKEPTLWRVYASIIGNGR